MRQALVLLYLAVGMAVSHADAAPAHQAGSFALSVKGYQATIIEIVGEDTSAASATGKVRRGDAKEYCLRDPGGATTAYGGTQTLKQCITEVLAEERRKTFSVRANCDARTIESTVWSSYYRQAVDDRPGHFSYVMVPEANGYRWKDQATGELLDGSSASGAAVVDLQYQMLCPKAAKTARAARCPSPWQPEHSGLFCTSH